MTYTLTAPTLASFREDAQRLLTDFDDFAQGHVILDCSDMRMASPSFLDEFIKGVFGKHKAGKLSIVPVQQRTADLAQRVARAHGLVDKVKPYGTWADFQADYPSELVSHSTP